MQQKQNHIIYSNSVELEFHDRNENFFLQNHIAGLVKERLLPALEVLFNEQTASGKKIKIDSLELDLGEISNNDWENKFVNETIYKLRQKLNEIISFSTAAEVYEVSYKEDMPVIGSIQSTDEAIKNLGSFLQTGTLPWNVLHTAGDLLDTILKAARENKLSPAQKEKITSFIFYTEETLKRFILQFADAFLIEFVAHVLRITDAVSVFRRYEKVVWQNLNAKKTISKSSEKKIIWFLMLMHSYAEKKLEIPVQHVNTVISLFIKESSLNEVHLFNDLFSEIKDLNVLLKKIYKPQAGVSQQEISANVKSEEANKQQNRKLLFKTEIDAETLFINNAGLVILSPFLRQMFISLGLSNSKAFISEEAQERAVLLSQYLVTGKTEIAEHELALNKILCGFPLEKTLPSAFEVSENEITQCNELLQSVLEYWKELKTKNTDSLVNTFIIREGKLVDKHEYWQLQVEYKSYDIMLQFLQWSIGIIFLPWMQKRLMVEWHA